MTKATVAFLTALLLCSTAWGKDLPKYSGKGFTCEKFAFPGDTVIDFWDYVQQMEGESRDRAKKMMPLAKVSPDELESLMIWTTPEVEQWSRLFVAYRVSQSISRGSTLTETRARKTRAINYVLAAWKEVGFASSGRIKECDGDNPKHKKRIWTQADWSPESE